MKMPADTLLVQIGEDLGWESDGRRSNENDKAYLHRINAGILIAYIRNIVPVRHVVDESDRGAIKRLAEDLTSGLKKRLSDGSRKLGNLGISLTTYIHTLPPTTD